MTDRRAGFWGIHKDAFWEVERLLNEHRSFSYIAQYITEHFGPVSRNSIGGKVWRERRKAARRYEWEDRAATQ